MILLVGARGFEPPTPCSQSRCATRLRHAPISNLERICNIDALLLKIKANIFLLRA